MRFPFCVPAPFGPRRHTGGQESTFRDIAKLLLTQERYYVRDIVPITVLCGCEVAFPRWCGRNVYAIGGAACVFRAVGFSQYFYSSAIASGSREWGGKFHHHIGTHSQHHLDLINCGCCSPAVPALTMVPGLLTQPHVLLARASPPLLPQSSCVFLPAVLAARNLSQPALRTHPMFPSEQAGEEKK